MMETLKKVREAMSYVMPSFLDSANWTGMSGHRAQAERQQERFESNVNVSDTYEWPQEGPVQTPTGIFAPDKGRVTLEEEQCTLPCRQPRFESTRNPEPEVTFQAMESVGREGLPERNMASLSQSPIGRSEREPQVSQCTPLRKQMRPPCFDGKTGEVDNHLLQFERTARWNRWSYEEKGAQLVLTMKGLALQVIGDLPAEQAEDYNTLREALKRRFDPKERQTSYRVEFRTRKKKKGETMEEYGYALSHIATKAYADMPASAREMIVMEQFISGLGCVETQRHVQFGHPKTLDQAVALGTEFVAFQEAVGGEKARKPAEAGRVYPVRKTGFTEDARAGAREEDFGPAPVVQEVDRGIAELLRRLEEKVEALTAEKRQREEQRKRANCFNCGGQGHWAKACPQQTTRVVSAGRIRGSKGPSRPRPEAVPEQDPGLN